MPCQQQVTVRGDREPVQAGGSCANYDDERQGDSTCVGRQVVQAGLLGLSGIGVRTQKPGVVGMGFKKIDEVVGRQARLSSKGRATRRMKITCIL